MALDIDQIKKNYDLRKNNIVADDVLNYFEKILEEAGIYGYKNWEKGLVVSGPKVQRYWVNVSLMYAETCMPEPDGGMRLKKYGCEVYFEKGQYAEPVRVMSKANLADQRTKRAELKNIPVWIVHIKMPRRLIDNAIDDYVSLSALEVSDDEDTAQPMAGGTNMDPSQAAAPTGDAAPADEALSDDDLEDLGGM